MNIGAAIGGLVGGLVGAAVWAAIVYFTGYEVGYVAWGVGLGVGFGVVQGSGGELNISTAVLAVVITVSSIALGKYRATYFVVEQGIEQYAGYLLEPMSDEHVIGYEGDEIINDRVEAGTPVAWPEGVEPGMQQNKGDYPPDVWAEAEALWSVMDASGRAVRRDRAEGMRAEGLAMWRSELRADSLKDSFSPIDLIFFALAIATAFKMTNGAEEAA